MCSCKFLVETIVCQSDLLQFQSNIMFPFRYMFVLGHLMPRVTGAGTMRYIYISCICCADCGAIRTSLSCKWHVVNIVLANRGAAHLFLPLCMAFFLLVDPACTFSRGLGYTVLHSDWTFLCNVGLQFVRVMYVDFSFKIYMPRITGTSILWYSLCELWRYPNILQTEEQLIWSSCGFRPFWWSCSRILLLLELHCSAFWWRGFVQCTVFV